MERPFSRAGEELKCESQENVEFHGPCSWECVLAYSPCAETSGGRRRRSLAGTQVFGRGTHFIPADIRELCGRCFFGTSTTCRLQVSSSSSPERSGLSSFEFTGLEEISIPDGVRELCDRCFFCAGVFVV